MTAKLHNASGMALIGVGLLGIALPVIPGIPLVLAGAAMLGSNHPLVRAGREWLQDRGILKKERNGNELSDVQS